MRRKSCLTNQNRVVWTMTAPAIALMIFFVIIPLCMGLSISFTNWNGYSQRYSYIGFENYLRLLSDSMFHRALRNTLIYGVGSTILQTVLGVLYALVLNRTFALKNLMRTVVYIPAMLYSIVVGYVWCFMVQYSNGALNDILLLFGLEKLDWMGNGDRAVWMITLINTLNFCGKAMLIYLAGLNGIPKLYYEAASIDGANGWQAFWSITLPNLLPAITTSTILNLIGGLKLFGIIVSLTGGGPGYGSHSLSTLINTMYFSYQDAGYASAIGIFTFLFIMAISIALRVYFNYKEVRNQ